MPRNNSETGRIVLGSLLYTAGSAVQYVTPAYLSALSARLGFNEAQMGSISAAENVGIGLASLVIALWAGGMNRRFGAIAAVVGCVVFDALAFFSRSFEFVAVERFLAGLLGEGILFSLAFLVLRSTRRPERSFGIALTSVVTFASLVLAGAPVLDRIPFGAGILVPLAAIALIVPFAVVWMPEREPPAQVRAATGQTQSGGGLRAVIALAAMAMWFAAPGAFWSFAESAATSRQVATADISISLAIGNAVGLLGSLAAAWQADRWGRLWPIAGATLCLCLSVAAFDHRLGVLALAASLSGVNVFWNYGAVYEMGLVVALDPTGRATAAISAPQVLGFAAGGFAAGFIILGFGFSALSWAVALFAFAGLLMFLPGLAAGRPGKGEPDAGSASGR